MKTLDRLNIKSLDGLAVMNVNEPSVGDYERIMAENRRLVAASAEYEKIIAELEGALEHYEDIAYIKCDGVDSLGNEIENEYYVAAEALQNLKDFRNG